MTQAKKSKNPLQDVNVVKGVVFAAFRIAMLTMSVAMGVLAAATIPVMIAGYAVPTFFGFLAGAALFYGIYNVIVHNDPIANSRDNAAKSLCKDFCSCFK